MLNDFMNCRMRMSFRLLGMAHRKKSAVTTRKGNSRPTGIKGASISSFSAGPCFGPIKPVEMLKVKLPSSNAIGPQRSAPENAFLFGHTSLA